MLTKSVFWRKLSKCLRSQFCFAKLLEGIHVQTAGGLALAEAISRKTHEVAQNQSIQMAVCTAAAVDCLFFLFSIVPYYGLTIAFKNFSPFVGIADSPWVGLRHFERLMENPDFYRLLRNTLLISLYKLGFGFPVPILFALLLNEVRSVVFKRSVQTITYFPHFLSWVVFGGIVVTFLTPSGVINAMLKAFGMAPVNFLVDQQFLGRFWSLPVF